MSDNRIPVVDRPQGRPMDSLCDLLRGHHPDDSDQHEFPRDVLHDCVVAGVPRWFLPQELGGWDWSAEDQILGYVRLAAADLTTTFILTQSMGACRRIAQSDNSIARERWLPSLVSGDRLGTVGISHLTTSRQHLSQPVLTAVRVSGGYELSGFAPWVTGGAHVDVLVLGATLADGNQLLVAVDTTQPGVHAGAGVPLVALSASCTDQVRFENVLVSDDNVLAGPRPGILGSGPAGGAGGYQTSALALGLAESAIDYLEKQAETRRDLAVYVRPLRLESNTLLQQLLRAASGSSDDQPAELRGAANRLVLRSTQAAMMAAKGAGYVEGHPVGRWCREALFFLVWSCPQPVSESHLCELAGLSENGLV